MVKLKIQSAVDILTAYLHGLGLKKEYAPQMLEVYKNIESSENIIASLDEIIYQKSKRIFKEKLDKIQLVALYKAIFLKCGLAEKYGIAPLLPNFEDKAFCSVMQNAFIKVAPAYKIAAMPTQKIDTIQLHKNKGEKKC